ncbi:hypothetical protein ACFQY7_22055 [Actinomadura luteofluorescens]|uniref:hypothetical protein n=1 Tax=Actinomadura luteofluorescens TaxID=46163 RepID=UPI003637EB50
MTSYTAPDGANPGRAALARSRNSRTASSGSRGGTRHTFSPAIRSGSLLVARIRSRGQRASSRPVSFAHSSTTCSQLSRTSRTAGARSAPASVSVSG